MKYYNLYIDKVENKFFTYYGDENKYKIGEQVIVEFGRQKKKALIVSEAKENKHEYELKEIKDKIKNSISFEKKQLELYLWIRDYYLSDFGDIIQAAFPKSLKSEMVKKCKLNKVFIPRNSTDKDFLEYMTNKKIINLTTLIKRYNKDLIEYALKENIIKIVEELKNKRETILIKSDEYFEEEKNILLTSEQETVKQGIINSNKKFFLIKGITGSGKTEVYINLIKDAQIKGKGAIFLVPEISLTPQMIKRFEKAFGKQIAILHSRLTDSQRAKEWESVKEGYKNIVVGVRSAIFAPVKNIEYIIIDEEHESTYKQDNNPRYDARYTAIKRAEIEKAKVIFGSATPLIESFYYAQNNLFEYFELNKRYNDIKMPKVEIVDMKKEKNENFSIKLLEEISKCLKKNEQVILLLNKKGYSNFVQCKSCGHIEKCLDCSVSYNYYKFDKKLKCSYCGKEKIFTGKCTKCGGQELLFQGYGTEKIEIELKQIFPEANILRIDSETVKDKDSYNKMYHDFYEKKYDIMLGTQIIAKGFHFPEVTLAGIISADTILNFPDFRAAEKTFQLIVQTSGRAGRGLKEGKVIVQTYNPENYVIQKAISADYKEFYEQEIKIREELKYPPYGKVINIIVSSENEDILYEKASEFYNNIKNAIIEFENFDLYGPFQAPIYKIKKRYRYQIFAKGERKLINIFKEKVREELQKYKEKDVRITVDIDPINLM